MIDAGHDKRRARTTNTYGSLVTISSSCLSANGATIASTSAADTSASVRRAHDGWCGGSDEGRMRVDATR